MRRSPIRATITLCLCLILAETVGGSAADMRHVQRLFRRKQYDEAERELRAGIAGLTGRPLSRALLVLATLERDVARAIGLYERVIAAGDSPEALQARLALARIYFATAAYRDAVSVLSRVVSEGSSRERMEALYVRALCWKQLGEPGNARAELNAIDRGELLVWSYTSLAELDMQEGRITDAAQRFESIGGGHANPVAGFKLGECYEILGQRGKALEVYRTLIRLFPESPEAPKAREKIQMIERHDRRGTGEGERAAEEPLDEEPVPLTPSQIEYTLQFGAFSERENALRLSGEIRREIPDVRLERFERDGRTWYRVRAGRYASRSEAEEAAARIQERTGYFSKPLPRE